MTDTTKQRAQWLTVLLAIAAVLTQNIDQIAAVLPAQWAIVLLGLTNIVSALLPELKKRPKRSPGRSAASGR